MVELVDPVRGSSPPDTVWVTTNVAEATPDLLSPLCWSIWGASTEYAWLHSMYDFGVLGRRDMVVSPDPNDHLISAIYGRQAFNVDVMRPVIGRIPGLSADDFERDFLGQVREGLPKTKPAYGRLPVLAVKTPYTLLATHRRLQERYQKVRTWWENQIFGVDRGERTQEGSSLQLIEASLDMFNYVHRVHSVVRFMLQGVQSAVQGVATNAGNPALADAVLSGQGGVAEMRLADDAWRLAHGEMTEEEFLFLHGFHGPNEGNVYTHSWRERPDILRNTVKAYLGRDMQRPRDRERHAMERSKAAAAELMAAARPKDRTTLRFILPRARNVIRNVEIGKTGFLMALDGARAAARRLGAEQVEQGRLAEVDDAFFLTRPELGRLVDGELPEAAELIAFRREAREEYRHISLPGMFTGMPGTDAATTQHTDGGEIRGAASGGGTVQGRARVVVDPNADVELDDGDILVCKFTDPSWAPLFVMAAALVIDIGSNASHGAVVAREMGLPFVIGTNDGTSRIPDGSLIEVDGGSNLVRVLD